MLKSIKKKKERRAALVTGKIPKLGDNYNLLREACYEAPVHWIRQIKKIPLCLEQVFPEIDLVTEDVKISARQKHILTSSVIDYWTDTAKRNEVVNYNTWFF